MCKFAKKKDRKKKTAFTSAGITHGEIMHENEWAIMYMLMMTMTTVNVLRVPNIQGKAIFIII